MNLIIHPLKFLSKKISATFSLQTLRTKSMSFAISRWTAQSGVSHSCISRWCFWSSLRFSTKYWEWVEKWHSRNGSVEIDLFEASRIFWVSSRGKVRDVVEGLVNRGLSGFNLALIFFPVSLMDFEGIAWLGFVSAVVYSGQLKE